MKTVTAVLPARNCRQELFKCLSVLGRSHYVPEIIVVDDGSDDGTRRTIRKHWPSVTCLSFSAHTGYAHAANAGLRLVRTEYAFLIRPGFITGKKCIERLLRAMEKEDVFCAVPTIRTADSLPSRTADRQTRGIHRRRQPGEEVFFPETLKGQWKKSLPPKMTGTIAVPDGCAMYRMQALEEIGWLDERHFDGLEAFDLTLRAALRGWKTAAVPGACVQRTSAGQEKGRSDTFRRQLAAGNAMYVFYKNIPAPVRALGLPMYAAADAVQIASFVRRGEFGAYRMAVERGRALCSMEKERRAALEDGAGIWPENLSDASFLGMEESAEKIYPLFLAEKEPGSLSRFGRYLRIQSLLAAGFAEWIRLLV